jgi:hypothetical protein
MKYPKNAPHHECAPSEFRMTPNMTGVHTLDAVIHHNPNPDIKARLALYGGYGAGVYKERTGYTGYNPEQDDL